MQFFSTAFHLLPFTFCQAPCLLSENWFFTVKNTIKATPEMLWTIFSRQHLVSVEPSCWQMWVTRGKLSCDVYSPALTLGLQRQGNAMTLHSNEKHYHLSWLCTFPTDTISFFCISFSPAANLPPHCLHWRPSGVPLYLLCGFSPPTKSSQVSVIRNLSGHQLPPSCKFWDVCWITKPLGMSHNISEALCCALLC